MDTLLDDLDAFLQEHRRCGQMDGGFDGLRVRMTCDCGALLAREPSVGNISTLRRRSPTGWPPAP